MVEKLKEELSSKEALLMHGKRGNKSIKINVIIFPTNIYPLVFSETAT
jgi:hypothetical protein